MLYYLIYPINYQYLDYKRVNRLYCFKKFIGVPISYTIIAFKSILKGLNKISINSNKISEDLENNWLVISEAIKLF